MPLENTASLLIKPSANYAIETTATVKNHSNWIEIGRVRPSAQCTRSDGLNCRVRQLQVHFNTSGFVDGTALVEELVLGGTAQGLAADPALVGISVHVISSPSFDLSTISIPTTVTSGESASVSISAVDTESLPITKARGRFMRLKLERAGVVVEHETKFRQEHADFYVNIPRTELEQTGVYKI